MKLSESGKIALVVAAGTVLGVAIGVVLVQRRKELISAKVKNFGAKSRNALDKLRETLDKFDEITANVKAQNSGQKDEVI